jgi:hypothetical protein
VTGWPLEYINDLPWPAVVEQYDYWQKYPPVHLLLAKFLGVKPAAHTAPARPAGPRPAAVPLTAAEQHVAALADVTPFAALPASVQEFVRSRKGTHGNT